MTNIIELSTPVLVYGLVGSEILIRECGVTDSDILSAVGSNATFQKDLGDVAKVVFLPDKLDPEKTGRYLFIGQDKTLANENLDLAVLYFLEEDLVSMVRARKFIHLTTMDGRNDLRMKVLLPRVEYN